MSQRRQRRRLPYTPPTGTKRPFWQRVSSAGWILMGLLLGLGSGLYYAWVIDPIIYIESGPSRLSDTYKAEYIYLVSQSFAADGNWPRAEQRLAALEDPNLTETVNILLENFVRDLESPDALRNMANLAQQLGAEGGAVAIFAPTPVLPSTPTLAAQIVATQPAAPSPTPAATSTPTVTPTPSPTVPPQPTQVLAFRLLDQERVCNQGETPLIEVVAQDAFLNDLPGVEVLISWADGTDRFFTGFKPDVGLGYGDFTMEPNISYTAILAEGSSEVSGLRVEPCDDGTDGGWRLIFQRLLVEDN